MLKIQQTVNVLLEKPSESGLDKIDKKSFETPYEKEILLALEVLQEARGF